VRIQVRLFGDVSKTLTIPDAVAADRFTIEQDLAAAWFNEADDHLERCRFTRAIRTEIAGDFAGGHDEADIVNGGDPGIELCDSA
jgi:hypothetical protein